MSNSSSFPGNDSSYSSVPVPDWRPFGFTTTPEQRWSPGPPYTTPSLQANLFFRVFLGVISVLVSGVPARLLWRNGEFAATVFCTAVVIRNIGYIINALIWRNDNVAEWYDGVGWCDLQVYINFASDTAFNTCLFEIMRSLYSKVGLDRVASFSAKERLRNQLISAAVIFTIPVVQLVLTYFTMLRRYNISTLVGCTTIYHFDWLFFVFYVMPTPVFVTLAAILAALVFRRFRRIEKATRQVVHSHDTIMSARQHLVRRKLYFMTLGILIIVVPLICALFVLNILDGWSYWSDPYDYELIVHGPDPFNHRFISFTTSDMVRFVDMNINYIPTLTSFFIFWIFGTTTEALNDYRRLLLLFGLGYIFPKLHQEYIREEGRRGERSWLSSLSRIFPNRGTRLASHSSSTKEFQRPTVNHVSHAVTAVQSQSWDSEKNGPSCSGARVPTTEANPWPDLSDIAEQSTSSTHPKPPNHNPLNLFRTSLPSASFQMMPAISLSIPGSSGKRKDSSEEILPSSASRARSAPPLSPLRKKTTPTKPKSAEEGDVPSLNAKTPNDAVIWTGNAPDIAHVNTRVWASESGRTNWDREPDEDGRHLGVTVRTEMRVASTIEEAMAASVAARMQAQARPRADHHQGADTS
ncbi:pheromone A receptor-domain-containing protein [Cercophora newfieldiana]|uniref:Pheromone A receptor-domain-containing protein n=1 Tax=Cercophora newfieldiana TaxID=92897 RepID=A0AA40CPK2_9PEZI|nr:pheromone A receptor-domain-containing protein [Cercophora newfieldiana]